MKLTFIDARAWKYIMQSIVKAVSETTIKVSQEGLRIKTMDEAKIVLIDFFLPASSFSEYEIDGELEFGVNLEDLVKVLRRAQKEDVLTLEVGESNYSITFKGKGIRRFTLPQLDLAGENIPEVDLQLDVKATMTPDVYREIVKDLEPIADTVTFVAEPSSLRIEAVSDLGEAEIDVPTETVLTGYEVNEENLPAKSSYGVEHLTYVTQVSQISNEAILEFSNEMPLRITFTLPEGGSFVYIVAPRVF
ncbi:integrase [Ignicoccus islandicus DSM 13165]|uniref:DNA polymerase sliding clamp n=1 Tax=Ignicoccus islandicus DSM 13165 TaxID=940295 RepID=A0A0U3F8I4_9CREN|nr:proliferating cell nuclear antigen (pcna) [Ignicoccus islandicus]ALU11945.1 integrase [Ignicoccus islandicus DSM 13165]